MSLLHTLGSPANGGAETYFLSLVTAFHRAGMAQAIVLRPHAGREAALGAVGVPFETAPFANPIDVVTRGRIARMARAHDAKIALAWMNRAAQKTPPGAKERSWARIGRLGGYYKLKNYRGFDALVGNTQDIVDWMVREGWPKERAHYIPNFAAAGEAAPLSRALFDTPENVPLLLGIGRLHRAKAHDVSLRALAQIPRAYLWIAGDGPEKEKLATLAGELGVGERVRFLGWREDAPALYRAADICVFPSRYEPLGNVVIQAWAHGLAVVAAASAGPAALVRDGEDGLLAPIDDAGAFAAQVRALIADPAARARLVHAGAKRVAADFSEAAVVAQWRALFARHGGV